MNADLPVATGAIASNDESDSLDWLRAKGLSDPTVAVYRYGIRHFARWYWLSRGKQLSAEDVDNKDLDDYLVYIYGRKRPQGPRLAGGTITTYSAAVRHFLDFALQK